MDDNPCMLCQLKQPLEHCSNILEGVNKRKGCSCQLQEKKSCTKPLGKVYKGGGVHSSRMEMGEQKLKMPASIGVRNWVTAQNVALIFLFLHIPLLPTLHSLILLSSYFFIFKRPSFSLLFILHTYHGCSTIYCFSSSFTSFQ